MAGRELYWGRGLSNHPINTKENLGVNHRYNEAETKVIYQLIVNQEKQLTLALNIAVLKEAI